jgi:hypothetical protein
MKKQLLPLLLLLCGPSVWAKETKSTILRVYPHFTIWQNNYTPGIPVNSRLVSQAYFIHDGTAFDAKDSTTYRYSFGRSGPLTEDFQNEYTQFIDDNLQFEESVTYCFDHGSLQYTPRGKRLQAYDPDGKVEFYTSQNWKGQANGWIDSFRYAYEYNSDNKVSETTIDMPLGSAGWTSRYHYFNDYAASGRLTVMDGTLERIEFGYDLEGRLETQVEQERTTQASVFVNTFRTTYDYNGVSRNPILEVIEEWDGAAWQFKTSTSYTYDADDLMLLEVLVSKWAGGGWSNEKKKTYTFDLLQNKIVCLHQVWDGGEFDDKRQESWAYNIYSQPIQYETKSWNAIQSYWEAAEGDMLYRFHYEDFDPTSIAGLGKGGEIGLYPVPATNVANVKVSFKESQESTVRLLDMQGRVVYQEALAYGRSVTTAVPVSTLPSGQYIVSVSGPRFSASRPLVVAR